MYLVTAEQMREIDRVAIHERGIPGIDLMERAGEALARATAELIEPGPILLACGGGNNGGDGFVAARLLKRWGYRALVWPIAGTAKLPPDARLAWERLEADGAELIAPADREALSALLLEVDGAIDAMLGTGARLPLRAPIDWIVEELNASRVPVVAADIPTGLDADTGAADLALRAARTVTFGLPKIGMTTPNGEAHCGDVWVESIGFPADLLAQSSFRRLTVTPREAARLLPPRPRDGHKGTFGTVVLIGGTASMPGAPRLAAMGAMRSGAGLVRVQVPPEVRGLVASSLPEVLLGPLGKGPGDVLAPLDLAAWEALLDRAKAVVFGPGAGLHDATGDLLVQLFDRWKGPLLIDADGLTLLARGDRHKLVERLRPNCVLTPHPGELARLLETTTEAVQADRWGHAEEAAARFGCVVVAKGRGTLVAEPNGRTAHTPTGSTALARGGSGDLLAGLIGGLMAQGSSPMDAAILGAFVHGLASDLLVAKVSARGVTVSECAEMLPEAWRRIEASNG